MPTFGHTANGAPTKIGTNYFLSYNPPIAYSPHYMQRFRNALATGAKTAEMHNFRLLIMYPSLLLPARLPGVKGGFVQYADLENHLGSFLQALINSYNLRWDPHLNPGGNKIIARTVLNILARKKLITRPVDSDAPPLVDRAAYWREYAAFNQSVTGFLASYVRFHQPTAGSHIIGGLTPPSLRFPIKGDAAFSFIVKKSKATDLVLVANNLSASATLLKVEISDRAVAQSQTITVHPGLARIPLSLDSELAPQDGNQILDVRITCASKPCRGIVMLEFGYRQ